MKQLRIGIMGTRGVPNHYGGFEQFAGYLSAGLAARGHQVWVYNSMHHPYQYAEWNDVHLIQDRNRIVFTLHIEHGFHKKSVPHDF